MSTDDGIYSVGKYPATGMADAFFGHDEKQVRQRRRSFGRWFRETGWRHVVALLALAFALFPVLWVVSAAFSDGNLSRQQLIPENPSLDNFRELMTVPNHPPFWSWFRNSLVVGIVTAVVSVFLCACAAYAFSRLRFKGRRAGMLALLLIQMFPNLLAMVATVPVDDPHRRPLPERSGSGPTPALVLIYLGGALGVNTWLMKGFMDTIPKELDEAARVDGATHVQIFFKVILPLAAPVLAVIGLLSFITTPGGVPPRRRDHRPERRDAADRSASGCRVSCSAASTIGGDRSPPAR